MMGFCCSEAVSLVFARGRYQRDINGSALVPVFVRRLTPETRQAVGRRLRGMGGSDLKGAGSRGHAARAAGSLIQRDQVSLQEAELSKRHQKLEGFTQCQGT